MKVFRTMYKDIEAIACETEVLKAIFLPSFGAKLTSLKNCRSGQEFLEQGKNEKYLKPIYGGCYTDAECSAFDDMFPTIDSFICNEYPWQGVEYPDHGEVYALPWEYEVSGECLHMWVYSVRFGYRLDKWVTEEQGRIMIRYKAENLTDFELPYIYAAHCMLAAQEGALIELPYNEVETAATTAFSKSGCIGGYGSKISWPVYEEMDLSKVGSKSLKDSYKFYFDEKMPEGKCTYRYPDGTGLIFGFDHKELAYLAIWFNMGGLLDKYNIAFEPCSGVFDRPDIAKLHNRYSVLNGKEIKEWYVSFAYEEKDTQVGGK